MCLCFSDVLGSVVTYISPLGSVLVICVFVHVLLMCYPLQTSLSDMSSYVIPFVYKLEFSLLVV